MSREELKLNKGGDLLISIYSTREAKLSHCRSPLILGTEISKLDLMELQDKKKEYRCVDSR